MTGMTGMTGTTGTTGMTGTTSMNVDLRTRARAVIGGSCPPDLDPQRREVIARHVAL